MCVDIEITERVVLFWDITIDMFMRVAVLVRGWGGGGRCGGLCLRKCFFGGVLYFDYVQEG